MKTIITYSLLLFLTITALTAFSQHFDQIEQEGNNNNSLVIQNFDLSSTAFIGNIAYSIQKGDKNTGLIDQIGDDNKAFSYQTYIDHESVILISGKLNTTMVIQSGEDDDAFVRQSGYKNLSYTVQAGNENISNIFMNADNSKTSVIQYGDGNNAKQIMGNGFVNFTSTVNGLIASDRVANSSFKAQQVGNDNYSEQIMQGSGVAVVLNIDNEGITKQTGHNNNAYQFISNLVGIAKNNYAYLTQDGDLNYSEQSIQGSFNSTNHYQLSNSNYASSTIIGNDNYNITTQQ